VSKAIPVMRDNSRWDSARSRLSRLNLAPSTSVNLLFILTFYYYFIDKTRQGRYNSGVIKEWPRRCANTPRPGP
jgi:hypothetical protein